MPTSPSEFLELVSLAADGQQPRIVQLCVQDHSDQSEPHLHVQVHFKDQRGTLSSTDWCRLEDVELEDLQSAAQCLAGRRVNVHMHGLPVRRAAAKAVVEALRATVHELTEAEVSMLKAEERGTCPICLLELSAGDELLCLPCDGAHAAHWQCLRPWLARAATCPACRFALPVDGAATSAAQTQALVKKSSVAVERLTHSSASSLASSVSARRLERAQARERGRSETRSPPGSPPGSPSDECAECTNE